MSRSKAEDPKVTVSLRVKRSVAEALKPGWRGQAEAYLETLAAGDSEVVSKVRAEAPKPLPRKATMPVVKTDALGVQFGPSKMVAGGRLKKR